MPAFASALGVLLVLSLAGTLVLEALIHQLGGSGNVAQGVGGVGFAVMGQRSTKGRELARNWDDGHRSGDLSAVFPHNRRSSANWATATAQIDSRVMLHSAAAGPGLVSSGPLASRSS
jgi:hypothetical protein